MLLQVADLSKSFDDKKLFENLNFTLEKGEKLAPVGPNGSGKSTLLDIIAGKKEADSGFVQVRKNSTVYHMPQSFEKRNITLRDYLKEKIPSLNRAKFFSILNRLSFEFSENDSLLFLSAGNRQKLELAIALSQESDLLLLDEPTNNLEFSALRALEDELKNCKAGLVFVSHDRAFLDVLAEKILDLRAPDESLRLVSGNYSDHLERKREFTEFVLNKNKSLRKKREALEKQSAVLKEKALKKAGGYLHGDNDKYIKGSKISRAEKSAHKAKAISDRAKRIKETEFEQEEKIRFKFSAKSQKGSKDIGMRELNFAFGSESSWRFNFDFPFPSKVLILGPNGSGKSTFLKILSGELKAQSGVLQVGSAAQIAKFDQEHEALVKSKNAFDFLKSRNEAVPENKIYNELKKLNISKEEADKKICKLSYGQRAKVLFASFALNATDVLLLDEPTNHLDLQAIEMLENLILSFEGSVFLVTHDRALARSFAKNADYILLFKKSGQVTHLSDLPEEYMF